MKKRHQKKSQVISQAKKINLQMIQILHQVVLKKQVELKKQMVDKKQVVLYPPEGATGKLMK